MDDIVIREYSGGGGCSLPSAAAQCVRVTAGRRRWVYARTVYDCVLQHTGTCASLMCPGRCLYRCRNQLGADPQRHVAACVRVRRPHLHVSAAVATAGADVHARPGMVKMLNLVKTDLQYDRTMHVIRTRAILSVAHANSYLL